MASQARAKATARRECPPQMWVGWAVDWLLWPVHRPRKGLSVEGLTSEEFQECRQACICQSLSLLSSQHVREQQKVLHQAGGAATELVDALGPALSSIQIGVGFFSPGVRCLIGIY